ncbi:hypothetical protein KIN20_001669 [Parelaphostrongylus tenuis]|uniref:Galectin n=1 Tax=Parelaphostrongylus tenuis TaxID=148309 RepID=A0AAD5LU09_PARTN|nr:hypothetical protein KIN20_001669 [Parelaphostrongylus tenuis]
MTAAPQRFPLPNIPFRREIHSGCAIGTSITCTAQAFQAKPKSFTIQLFSLNDIAILVTIPIGKNGQITATARVHGKFTSEVEKPIFLPIQAKFTLLLHVAQYVIEIYFNNNHIMDFVHRVNPLEIKGVVIEGPLIVDEVVFTPPQGACLNPLPTYEEATGSSVNPVSELRHMSKGAIQPMAAFPPQPPPAGFVTCTSDMTSNCSNNQEQARALALYSTTREDASLSKIYGKSSQISAPAPFPPHQGISQGQQTIQAFDSSSNIAQLPPNHSSIYRDNSQTLISGSVVPGTSYPQQTIPQPHASTQQYPLSYAGQRPYVHPQFPAGVPGIQIHPQYNPYQHPPPFPCPLPNRTVGPYPYGYMPQQYGTCPIIYGSTYHSERVQATTL